MPTPRSSWPGPTEMALAGLTDGLAPIAGIVSEVPARVGMFPSQGDPWCGSWTTRPGASRSA
jgi:hypothetical protein